MLSLQSKDAPDLQHLIYLLFQLLALSATFTVGSFHYSFLRWPRLQVCRDIQTSIKRHRPLQLILILKMYLFQWNTAFFPCQCDILILWSCRCASIRKQNMVRQRNPVHFCCLLQNQSTIWSGLVFLLLKVPRYLSGAAVIHLLVIHFDNSPCVELYPQCLSWQRLELKITLLPGWGISCCSENWNSICQVYINSWRIVTFGCTSQRKTQLLWAGIICHPIPALSVRINTGNQISAS